MSYPPESQVFSGEFADSKHAYDSKGNDEEQERVGDESVDGQEGKDDAVVG